MPIVCDVGSWPVFNGYTTNCQGSGTPSCPPGFQLQILKNGFGQKTGSCIPKVADDSLPIPQSGVMWGQMSIAREPTTVRTVPQAMKPQIQRSLPRALKPQITKVNPLYVDPIATAAAAGVAVGFAPQGTGFNPSSLPPMVMGTAPLYQAADAAATSTGLQNGNIVQNPDIPAPAPQGGSLSVIGAGDQAILDEIARMERDRAYPPAGMSTSTKWIIAGGVALAAVVTVLSLKR